MPRPIVPAHQRQRAAEACNLCRETKKRCSGSAPCTQCVRRGLESQCFITYAPRGSRARARAERAATTAASNSVTSTGRTSSVSNQSVQQNLETEENYRPLSPSHSQQDDDRDSQADASSATNPPRMLLNSRGERVYVGGAASISFLQIVRNLVSQQIGPSAFSHNAKSDTMLEIESPTATTHDHEINANLSPDQKNRYLNIFDEVTEGLIHIFDDNMGIQLTIPPPDNPYQITPQRQATLDLVVAIGAQCESFQSSKTIGQAYFRKARSQAFVGFLEDPDLEMVRIFILMAFYMLGECRRNAAFMYLGIAAKAALALGLHSRESYGEKPDEKDQVKLRVWLSVCILDKLVNSLLGRPSASAQIRSDSKLDDLVQPGDRITERLMAANKVSSIINDITDTLYDQKKVTTPIVEQFLQDIERWKRHLPDSVDLPRGVSYPLRGESLQDGAIGRVHVSCLYYLAVMLVTRPFLVSTLTAKPLAKGAHSQLAAACLDAAMYLSQTCVETLDAGQLQGNMCIMKALVFASGLILGLQIFAKHPAESDIVDAFQSAKRVLKHLSTQSPQAAHYLDILTTLSGAIDKRRSSESSTGRSRYVSKLCSLYSQASREEPIVAEAFPFVYAHSVAEDIVVDDAIQDWVSQEPEGGDFSLDWESLDVSLWDTYPFLS
ncbi:hypothetical protein FSST1_000195 [Fusarium sambucinum]